MSHFAVYSSLSVDSPIPLQHSHATPAPSPTECPQCNFPMTALCPSCGLLLLGIAGGNKPKSQRTVNETKTADIANGKSADGTSKPAAGQESSRAQAREQQRRFAEEFPIPESPDDIDPYFLEQACQGVLPYLYCRVQEFAEMYKVPEDILVQVLVDRLVSTQMGLKPTPAKFFIPEKYTKIEQILNALRVNASW